MNWIEKVVSIKDNLLQHGYVESVERITQAQLVLGTPGEMYLEVMHELVSIKKNFPEQFQLIKNEVKELIEYGKSLNYYHFNE